MFYLDFDYILIYLMWEFLSFEVIEFYGECEFVFEYLLVGVDELDDEFWVCVEFELGMGFEVCE